MKNKRPLKKNTIILLAASAILLLGSAIGSTSAALTYYSENYVAGFETYSIGVSLMENGIETDILLENLLGKDEQLVLGKEYKEEISVLNTGDIDSYVRVILRKNWKDAEGETDTSLSPSLIDLGLVTGKDWILDESATTDERVVLYYTGILAPGEASSAMTDTLRVDPAIGTKVIETVKTDGNGKTISYVYEYDGYEIHLEAEVDSVQTHNAEEAIKSAWGVDVNIASNGSLSLR